MKKRVLAIAVILVMLVSLMPTGAFASSSIIIPPGNGYTIPGQTGHEHNWVWTVTKEATCTEAGEQLGKCSICGATQRSAIPALGHEWVEEVITEAGCETEGVMERECSRCGEKETLTIPAAGHSWTAWFRARIPDATGKYTIERNCVRCGLEEEEEQNAGLQLEIVSAENTAGKRNGDYCTVTFKVTNNTGDTLTVQDVRDSVNGEPAGSDKISMGIAKLEPHASGEFQIGVYVSQNDIELGFSSRAVSVTAWRGMNKDYVCSNTVNPTLNYIIKDLGPEDLEDPYDEKILLIDQGIVNLPKADDCLYVPGEIVELFAWVRNASDYYLGDVTVKNYLTGETQTIQLGPKGQATVYFHYEVTVQDGIKGYAVSQESASCDLTGEVISDLCYLHAKPFGRIKGLAVSGSVTKLPESDSFRMGDVIEYSVSVSNTTKLDMQAINLYDFSTCSYVAEDVLKAGGTLSMTMYYTVKAEDAAAGFVSIPIYATATDTEGTSYAGADEIEYGIGGGDDNAHGGLYINIYEISKSKNEGYYKFGETVTIGVKFGNDSDETYKNVHLYDSLHSPTNPLDIISQIPPHTSGSMSFDYTITKDDVEKGMICCVATITGFDEENLLQSSKSGKLTLYTVKQYEDVYLYKWCDESPDRGFWVEGEEIPFNVFLSNTTGDPIYNVKIYDSLSDKTPLCFISVIGEEGWTSQDFKHTVTNPECVTGSVGSAAWVNYETADGQKHTVFSNDCAEKTGIILKSEIEIIQTVTSNPKNNQFYTENEVITYEIVITNTGETELKYCAVHDSLSGKYIGLIESVESLAVNATATIPFTHKVTLHDAVDVTYVENIAGVFAIDPDGVIVLDVCDPEISPCGENPVVKTSGYASGVGADSCSRTLNADADGDLGYTTASCAAHAAIDEQINAMVNTAADAAGRTAAWEQAQQLWTDEIDSIYQKLIEMADDPYGSMVIMNDRATFFTQMDSFAASLNEVYSKDAEKAARLVAEALKNQCADFCWILHHAGEDMACSLVGELGGMTGTECAVTALGDEEYRIDLCGMHRAAGEATAIVMGADATMTVISGNLDWTRVRGMWETEYDAVMDARYKDASGTMRDKIRAEHINYLNWINNHELFLDIFYENAVVRDSFMARTIMDRTALSCELSEGITNRAVNASGNAPVWNTSTGTGSKGGETGKDKGGFPGWAFAVIGVAAVGGAGGVVVSKKKKSGKGKEQ